MLSRIVAARRENVRWKSDALSSDATDDSLNPKKTGESVEVGLGDTVLAKSLKRRTSSEI
jgi:hypothetical protein